VGLGTHPNMEAVWSFKTAIYIITSSEARKRLEHALPWKPQISYPKIFCGFPQSNSGKGSDCNLKYAMTTSFYIFSNSLLTIILLFNAI